MMCCARALDFPVIVIAGENGYLVAECPTIPGSISQSGTREEALVNIQVATSRIRLTRDGICVLSTNS